VKPHILPNGVAVIEGDTHHAVWCEAHGLVHDKWMARNLTNLIDGLGIRHAVDGGANIGTLTRVMLDAGAKVVAFEPNPAAADCLAINCPKATIVRAALGRKHGYTALITQANAGASYLVKPIGTNPNEVLYEVKSLDAYYTGTGMYQPVPGLIKLDIEGSEYDALRGAEQVIAKARPVLVMEINGGALERQGADAGDIFRWLGAHKYRWRILQPDCNIHSPQYDIEAIPF
jgi:FkbM family methyltransferase